MYEPKENQVWIEKGESIAPPTSYVRERERERLIEKERKRERERESLLWWCWESDDMSST